MIRLHKNNHRGGAFLKLIVLAALAAGAYYGYQEYLAYSGAKDQNIERAKQDMELLMKKVDQYVEDQGGFPENMQALRREGYFEEGEWPMVTPWEGSYFIRDGYIECHIDNLQAQPLKRPFQGDLIWNVEYTGTTLPTESSPPWKKMGGAKANISVDQELVIEDKSRSEYTFFWLLDSIWRPLAHRGFTIDTELRTRRKNTTDISFRIMDGRYHSTVSFYPGYISFCKGNNDEQERIKIKTDNGFHTYRITIKGKDLTFFVDGRERIQVRGVHSRSTYDKRLGFGVDVSGSGTATANIKYVKLCLEGTFRP